jgi:hypothetical protein
MFQQLNNLVNKIMGHQPTRNDLERVQALWARHGVPQIIISFGARGGGAEFAFWLQEQLGFRKGLKGAQVYIDTYAMLNERLGETKMTLMGTKTAGIYKTTNNAWQGYFEYAMYEAHTMIFVVTQEWQASKNCWDEYSWFKAMNDYYPNRIKGISLVIEDDALGSGTIPVAPLAGTYSMRAKRSWSVKDAIARRNLTGNQRNVWQIDNGKVDQLSAMI